MHQYLLLLYLPTSKSVKNKPIHLGGQLKPSSASKAAKNIDTMTIKQMASADIFLEEENKFFSSMLYFLGRNEIFEFFD